MTLGRRIRQRLDEQDLKVSELARACGVTPGAVYQWINGDTKGLKPENLVCASEFLNTPIRWLVLERGNKERATNYASLPSDQAELLRYYVRLTSGEQRAIMATVQGLARKGKTGKKSSDL